MIKMKSGENEINETRKLPLKAYQNPGFLHGKDARVLRILSEYLEPASRLKWQHVRDTIVFFGSARIQPRETSEKRLEDLRKQLQSEAGKKRSTEAEIAQAENAVVLSRYYDEA